MQDSPIFWIFVVGFFVFCGYVAVDIASKKGYEGISFFVLGFIFNIIGILWAIGLPETQEYRIQQAIALSDSLEEHRQRKNGKRQQD